MTATLDQRIGQYLSASFPHQSRRSFLSQLTRGLFALAGVSLPAALAPQRVAAQAAAGGQWDWCGLHGFLCAGNCAPNFAGNRGQLGNPRHHMSMWVACCRNPGTGRWHCVTYADYCGTRGPTWGRGCPGVNPSGSSWCGRSGVAYICTDIQVFSQGHHTVAACARGCGQQPRHPQC